MDTVRVIDFKKEIEILKNQQENLKKELLKMEGIETYYLDLIKKNIISIPVPNTKKENVDFKQLLDDDDI